MLPMGKDFRVSALVLIAALASGATSASAPQTAPTISWDAAQAQLTAGGAEDAQTRVALDTWRRLASSDGFSFTEYADFLMTYRGWPEGKFRR